jgi:hypothetical protein
MKEVKGKDIDSKREIPGEWRRGFSVSSELIQG